MITAADASQEEAVIYEVTPSGVAVLTLNRPGRLNTWGGDIATAFYAGLDRAEGDSAVRVIVVTGRGKAFCAGAQLASMGNVAEPIEKTDERKLASLVGDRQPYYLTSLSKPVIAAINGVCAGGGLELALSCDFRLVAQSARLGFPEMRVGLIPGSGGCSRLVKAIGLLRKGRTLHLSVIETFKPSAGGTYAHSYSLPDKNRKHL